MIFKLYRRTTPRGRRLTDKEMKDYGYQQQRAEVYCPQPRAPRAD